MASVSTLEDADNGLALPFVSNARPEEGTDNRISSNPPSVLDSHSDIKGSFMAARSRLAFVRHLQISVFVGLWVVLLSVPFIIYPLSRWLESISHGCSAAESANECWQEERASCRWQWIGMKCVPTKPNVVLAAWGSLILQFVFSVHTSLGKTVRLSIQGFAGTFMAWLNVRLMDFLLPGGAYNHPLNDGWSTGKANSAWLPLCNTGTNETPEFCALNIHWSSITLLGAFQFSIIWLDFVLFVVAFLIVGSDSNTRMFALSTHVYFMMSFVNPTESGFHGDRPGDISVATQYMGLVGLACIFAIITFFMLPKRQRALESAEQIEEELVKKSALAIGCMHEMTVHLKRQKAKSILELIEIILNDFEEHINIAWHESYRASRRARRRRLRYFARCVRNSMQKISCVHEIAKAASASHEELKMGNLQKLLGVACKSGADLLKQCWDQSRDEDFSCADKPLSDFVASLKDVSQEFDRCREDVSPETCAFVSITLGALSDLASAIEEMTQALKQPHSSPDTSSWTWSHYLQHKHDQTRQFLNSAVDHLGLSLVDRSATHPRFVVRYTVAISLAFYLGWTGVWNAMPAYSSYSASTIAVIVYTYTGASGPVTMKRICGVVLGKVLGTIVLLMFGVQAWYYSLIYAASMWVVVSFNFFHYLHADKDTSYVACLTAAYAAQGMIPSGTIFRNATDQTLNTVAISIFNVVTEMIFGVAIMTGVDLLLSSRATKQARHRLVRTLLRTKRFVASTLQGHQKCTQMYISYKEDLDSLLQLIPYAAAEPTYWREPFKDKLYYSLEAHSRNIGSYASVLNCALHLFGKERSSEDSSGDDTCLLQSVCKPQLSLFLRETWVKLSEVEELVLSVARDSREDTAAYAELRQRMEENLYTVKAAKYIYNKYADKYRSSTREFLGRTASGRVASSQSHCVKLRHCCGRLWKAIRTEPLPTDQDLPVQDEDAIPNLPGEANLLEIRRLVRSNAVKINLPTTSHPWACAELVIFLLKSILAEIEMMQFELLEY